MINFWWIRHAPVINNKDCCYGDNEVECDISNTKKFNYLAKVLPADAIIYTSTLSRAKKTFFATEKAGLKYKLFFEDERLKEQNIGKFAGMKYEKLYKLTKKLDIYNPNWLMNETYTPDDGESFIDVNNRINSFLIEKIRENNQNNFIIFSHGGPIRSAINIALCNEKVKVGPFQIDNLKVTKIVYYKGKWQIDFINS